MTQITKNQHIVPERHLKNFTIPSSTKLECLNVDALRIEKPQLPMSICSGPFHYAVKPGREDEYSQMAEKAFGTIEDWYGKNIERIETRLLLRQKLSNADKHGVSWIITNFYFRGYKFRNQTSGMINEVIDWLAPPVGEHIHQEFIKAHPTVFSGDEKEKELVKKLTRDNLSIYSKNTSYATARAFDEGFVNTLIHKKWEVLINNSLDYPFITGDEAVIEPPNDVIPGLFSMGFLSLNHVFHLSSKIAIIASYPFTEEEHGQVLFRDISENKFEIFKSNLLYVNHTHKYAYASNKNFFEWLIDFEKRKIDKILV